MLGRVIPDLIESVLRVAVDPIFPGPKGEEQKGKGDNPFKTKLELIF